MSFQKIRSRTSLPEGHKFVIKMLQKADFQRDQLKQTAWKVSFLQKFFVYCCDNEAMAANKNPQVQKMLLAGAVLAQNARACRVMVSASMRAVRKMGCENLSILDEIQKIGVAGLQELIGNQEAAQFSGSSTFEILEVKYFTIYCGFDKYM